MDWWTYFWLGFGCGLIFGVSTVSLWLWLRLRKLEEDVRQARQGPPPQHDSIYGGE